MKFDFTDSQGAAYIFEFDRQDIIVRGNGKLMAMPIEQVISNSEPWQFLTNSYIKMSAEAISYIEKLCKNKAFF